MLVHGLLIKCSVVERGIPGWTGSLPLCIPALVLVIRETFFHFRKPAKEGVLPSLGQRFTYGSPGNRETGGVAIYQMSKIEGDPVWNSRGPGNVSFRVGPCVASQETTESGSRLNAIYSQMVSR